MPLNSRVGLRRQAHQRGAVAIMVSLSMTALCISTAFVIDFGLLRVDRQQNKSAADAAAVSGARGLAANTAPGTFQPFNGVCQALSYLQANASDFTTFASSTWTDGAGTPVAGPCTAAQSSAVCKANNPSTWAQFRGSTAEGITVRIQSGYKVNEGGWVEESLPALSADPGVSRYGGCDQLAVMIHQSRKTTLGSLAVESVGSGLRSVARVNVAPPRMTVALLILERHDCQALAITSAGAGGRIDVNGAGPNPGLIHVDSDGTGAGCNKPIILGKNPGACPDPAPPAAPTCGGIVAHESEDGLEPGVISTVATANTSDGIPQVYAGPYPPGSDPVHRDAITRQIVDDIYLEGVKAAVDASKAPFSSAASGVAPAGFTAFDCNVEGSIAAPKAFVDCGNYSKDANFTAATEVIFTGQVSSANLHMPKAERVYIVGGSAPAGVSVGTTFAMHDNDVACSNPSNSPLPATGVRARLFIKTGALKASGGSSFRACNTTVILMGGDPDACLPPTSPYVLTYTNTPCAGGSPGNGVIDFGGGATIDWTAPNKVLTEAASLDDLDLEDLALWDETYDAQNIGGGGFMHLEGVFMAPNAIPFKINGGGTQDVTDSQYVVRQLWNTGNGTLAMQPPSTLPVRLPELSIGLVR